MEYVFRGQPQSGLDEAAIEVEELQEEFVVGHRYALAIPLNEYAAYRECLTSVEGYIVNKVQETIGSLEKKLNKKVRVEHAG